MSFRRLIGKFRTEFIATIIALIFIAAGLISPYLIPVDEYNFIRPTISVLLIGTGVVCFFWLVIIHRFIVHQSKKDYMY
jgi:uncharacterized membrane protein